MPVHCTIDGRVLLFSAEGDYRLNDVRTALDAAIESPDFVAPMCLLADAVRSTANPSVAEIRDTADYLRSVRHHFAPSWVLVVRGSLRYGLARMLSVFTEAHGIHLQVHRNLEEGRRAAQELAA